MISHIGSAHNKVENYLPEEFWLPRSIRGNFLKVPSTTGSVSDITKDQDQHQDQGEISTFQISPEADLAPGKTKELDESKGKEKETKEEGEITEFTIHM